MIEIIFKYWLEILLTLTTSFLAYIFKEYSGFKNGLKALLRNEIVRIYETYSKLGYCPSYMKENANEIYLNYHKLKGNGFATALIKEIYALPNEKEELYEKNTE